MNKLTEKPTKIYIWNRFKILAILPVSYIVFSCAPAIYNDDSSLGLLPNTVYSKSIIITKGGTYSGNWESQDAKTPAISIQTSEPVIIENSNIRGRGTLIKGFGNNITIRNVNGFGLNPNLSGARVGWFLAAEEFINVKVENIYAENTGGIYLRSFKGDSEKGNTVIISKNQFKNINGLPSTGKGGYSLDAPDGIAHMIQFNDVNNIKNSEISWNEVINEPGKSQVEENINMYVSSGTPTSPILIHDNYIQGAYTSKPEIGEKYSGGGIIVGDGAIYNTGDSGYTRVYNNQIVSTTNQGIVIAGGVDNKVYDNRIISSGLLMNGSIILAQNVGIYLWNADAAVKEKKVRFLNNSMTNNYVVWTKVKPDGSRVENPWWFPDCDSNNKCEGNISGSMGTLEMEKQEYYNWLEKLSKNQVKIGKLE